MHATDAPCHLDLLFSDGAVTLRDATWDRDVVARRREFGEVALQGMLIGDPFSNSMAEVNWPGATTMPTTGKGRAVVVDCGESGDRVASLAIFFVSDQRVATWKRCDVGVETDCSVGGFASAGLQRLLDDDAFTSELLNDYEAQDGYEGAVLCRDGQALLLSSTGWGDGAYDAWWGISNDGKPVCIAIDFDVLSEGTFTEERVPLPLSRRVLTLSQLPGVTLETGILSRTKPKLITRDLPEGHSVYTRVLHADGTLEAPPVRPNGKGGATLDLRPFSTATHLLVRLVTGYRPMEILHKG